MGRARLVSITAALIASTACTAEAPRSAGVRRLLPALGAAEQVRLDGETRPAILLRPGERRSATVTTRNGDRLLFALGGGPRAPARGRIRVDVRANGRAVFQDAVPLGRGPRWWRQTAPLPASPQLRLDFAVDWHGPPDAALPAEPWIAIGSPRIDAAPEHARRVVLWISYDTLRADHLGAWGYARPTSPRLDARLREFVVFDQAISTSSWTLPALASQMTGRYPTAHGAVHPRAALSPGVRTVFEALAEAGFMVLGVTANVYVSTEYGLARGFDALWYTQGRALGVGILARRALLERGRGDVALFLHYMDPHSPYAPPAPFDRRFGSAYDGPVDGRNYADRGPLSRAEMDHVQALYDGEIAYADEEAEALLRDLAREGLMENAVVVVSADHGEEFQEHGSWHHGGTLYREVVHVPLAMRVLGIPGRRVPDPVSLVDLAPTVLDAVGVPPPATFMGRSLLPRLRGRPAPPDPIFAETELTATRSHLVSLRDGPRAFFLSLGASEPPEGTAALYDLASDPAERIDRPRDPEAARLRSLALAFLKQQRAAAAARRAADLEPETVNALRALGYVE
jgi:arylsulfatase A-like enzyme